MRAPLVGSIKKRGYVIEDPLDPLLAFYIPGGLLDKTDFGHAQFYQTSIVSRVVVHIC